MDSIKIERYTDKKTKICRSLDTDKQIGVYSDGQVGAIHNNARNYLECLRE